jgi:hypothetical protein
MTSESVMYAQAVGQREQIEVSRMRSAQMMSDFRANAAEENFQAGRLAQEREVERLQNIQAEEKRRDLRLEQMGRIASESMASSTLTGEYNSQAAQRTGSPRVGGYVNVSV